MKRWESNLALPFLFLSLGDSQIWWQPDSCESLRVFHYFFLFKTSPSIYLGWRTGQVTHETRHNNGTSSRARLRGWQKCVCLSPADPGFPGLDSPCPPPLVFGGSWAVVRYILLYLWGTGSMNYQAVCWFGLGGFFRQIYLVGFVYSNCYQELCLIFEAWVWIYWTRHSVF